VLNPYALLLFVVRQCLSLL